MTTTRRACTALLALAASLCLSGVASAAPRTFTVTGTVEVVEGTYLTDFSVGDPFSGTFIHDTDEANADPGAITTPSTVPGHEFSSFYEFSGSPYGVSVSFPAIPGSFTGDFAAVVVNDDLLLTSDDTNGAVADGTYDWIEVHGSTAVGICLLPGGSCAPDEFSPADGEEWTVAMIADPNWISDGSLIPDDLPSSHTALLVGIEVDPNGVEVGLVFANATIAVSAGPAPIPVLPFTSTALLASLLLLGAGYGASCR